MQELKFGAGDTIGRTTVSILRCNAAKLFTSHAPGDRPCPASFYRGTSAKIPLPLTIRVPPALGLMTTAWVESFRTATRMIEELRILSGIAHWPALMRLLGGSDCTRKPIAHGPSPGVVIARLCYAEVPPSHPYGEHWKRGHLYGNVLNVVSPNPRSGRAGAGGQFGGRNAAGDNRSCQPVHTGV